MKSFADDSELRIAVWSFPPRDGNPFITATVPEIMIIPAIFDGLTVVRQNGSISPALATAWEQKEALVWEFKLRENVTFSNGRPFNAGAVTNAITYLTQGVGSTTSIGRSIDMIVDAERVDDLTVRISTHYPAPLLPYEISSVRIPEPTSWNTEGVEAFSRNPIGTGPYSVVNWGKAEVHLTSFSSSWRKPLIKKLNFYAVPDETARLQALQSDAMDIALGISHDAEPVLRARGGRVVTEKSASILGLSFVTTKDSIIQNRKVRQALNFAVNREAIIEALYGGVSSPAGQITIPEAFGYNTTLPPYPYDPDRARILLAEAGYEDGFDFPIEINTSIGGNAAAIFQQVAADLSKIRVRVNLIQMSTVVFIQRVTSGGWKGMAFTMDYNSTRALDGLKPFKMHSCLRAVPWYCDPSDTPLIEAALREPVLEQREKMTQELLRRYYDDPAGIMLFQMAGTVGIGPRIKNYEADFGVIRFDEISFNE